MGRKKSTEPKPVAKFTIFDWLKEITLTKRPWESFSDEQKKEFNVFMINKYLSMSLEYVELVNYAQFIPYSEKEKYYKIYCEFIPKKNVWLKYIKSSKKSFNTKLTEHLATYFQCSTLEAADNADLLDKETIVSILVSMGIEDKEIKTLLK